MVPTNEVKTDNQLDTHDHPDACALGTKGHSHTDLVEKESETSKGSPKLITVESKYQEEICQDGGGGGGN